MLRGAASLATFALMFWYTRSLLAAVAVEPLRENAQRALVEAQLAEGNRSGAVRGFLEYEALLQAELGIGPTAEFRRLVGR